MLQNSSWGRSSQWLKGYGSASDNTRVSTAVSPLRLRLAAVLGGDRCEAGGIITGWLLKLTIVLALLAVVGFDAASIGSAKVSASNTASDAAMAASVSWNQDHNVQQAYDAASSIATEHDATVLTKGFSIDNDGTVHLTVHGTAMTLVVSHIKPARHWASLDSAGVAKDVT